ncbi:Gfo/Idh/MocA family protein [Cohnella cellulosilytica]|uniref:Gfo/Idh/MocA family protein n=1 Tax=Cohnella cellulosilytica TaxID=986710 RepID=A0ABW2F822_9BACL
MNEDRPKIRSAIVGYGGEFNMGKHHAGEMEAVGIELAAVCDIDPKRAAEAARDFPHIRTFTNVEELLSQPDIDLVTLITPHNTHADLAMRTLEHGKHCILEKPMCIHAEDADKLARKARESGLMLSVYHNRRWNDWYLTVQDLIRRELLGDIFFAEFYFGGYERPRTWWRSDKAVSGGAFYDWGAHYMDWVLGLIPSAVKSARGYSQKLLWQDVSNEDHLDGIIQFENGAVVHAQTSAISRAGTVQKRILGTKGAVTIQNKEKFLTLYTEVGGVPVETKVPFLPGKPLAYYANIADHLANKADLIVTPEQARRVISVLESVTKSAELGREIPVPYENI